MENQGSFTEKNLMQKEPILGREILSTDTRAPILKQYQKERRILHLDHVERKENKIWFRHADFSITIRHLFGDVRALKAGGGKS